MEHLRQKYLVLIKIKLPFYNLLTESQHYKIAVGFIKPELQETDHY